MSSLSADRKPPVDYGVQIRFIKDLDDVCGGYTERSRGVGGAGAAGGSGTPPSSKYGVAVRVQGISGQPYVVLKDGEKGDSYGVQLKPQPKTPILGLSSSYNSLPPRPRDSAQTPKDPCSSLGSPSSPEEETVEFGSPLKRPPGDGQAGSQGDGERGTTENPASVPSSRDPEKKDLGDLNEAGLRPVWQTGIGGTVNGKGKRGNQYTSTEPFPEASEPEEEPVEAIDTKSLAPINKLISKFNSTGTSTMPSRIRGRSRARACLQFEERKRSHSLDARKEQEEEPPPSPTVNPYGPTVNTTLSSSLTSPKRTNYSSLGQSSPSIAKVPAVPASKAPTVNQTPKMFVAKEVPPDVSKKQVTPDLLSGQSQSTDSINGREAQEKQVIYEVLKEGSVESETSLRRKANLIHERYRGLKEEHEATNSRLQHQLDQTKRELQHAQDRLVELRLEKEGAESRFHQQEDQLAQLQEELRRVSESTPQTDSLQMDLVTLQTELAEVVMLRQKLEETLHMRERELTALKGALKDEVAVHDREMEAVREQYSRNMEALQKSMEHVSQSQQEIEEERQKVNASILVLEEELDNYREQGEHWKEQMTSVKQELLQAQQEKKELEEKLLSLKKQTCETDSHSFTQVQELQRCLNDLKQAHLKIDEQKAELVKKGEELRALKRTSQNKEQELEAEIDKLKDQSKMDREELSKVLEKKQQSLVSSQDPTSTDSTRDLQEANNRLRERISRMSRLHNSLPDSGASDALEEENRYLKTQLEEARRAASRLSHEKEELGRQLEEKEAERETLRRGKADLEEQKRLLDRALEKMNKDIDLMMGDSRQSVQNLQSQLDEFRDRSRKELQESQRLNKDRLVELQRTQNSLKAAQEEVSRLKKELLVCSEERDSAQLDKELLSSRLKHKETELDSERTSQTDRSREIRLLEDKVKTLEIELDEEKTGAELLNERITRTREQVDQLRSELMQERSARNDLEMDKSSLERQVKELKSRLADMEGQPRSTAGVTMLENKIQELEDRLRSEEREKSSIQAAQRRTERKLKDVSATLDQERSQHAEQRDQLSLRVKALKRQVDDTEGEVERLEGVRRKILRDLEEQQELKDVLQAKVSALENELRRKIQQTRRPMLGSTLSSEEDDGCFDSSSIASILTESQLQTTTC
ncbi:cingulin isoform X2 [Ictalurus punctatus]|uniref:Cingulin isoform X2 n=1 Tax=Ictalurus punctatus TaxID=7998 RepID=A0A2D0S4S4_ICTPU|nr:cingulin isoform X2 [Ictalurus punctatus]